MDGIHQHLALTVSAVRQLDFRFNLVRIGVLGFRHRDFKGKLLVKSQTVQPCHKIVFADFKGCPCKVYVIRVNIGIFKVDRAVAVKGGNVISAPARILPPA